MSEDAKKKPSEAYGRNQVYEASWQERSMKAQSAPDALSQKGAMALAHRLQDFWLARGYPDARFWAVPIGERFPRIGTYDLYRVECNLVNGLPPRASASSR